MAYFIKEIKYFRMDLTDLNENQISKFLYVLEGTGTIFVGSFLAAYLMGLPTNIVYHSDPILRILLSLFGGLVIILVLTSLLISAFNRKKDS